MFHSLLPTRNLASKLRLVNGYRFQIMKKGREIPTLDTICDSLSCERKTIVKNTTLYSGQTEGQARQTGANPLE